MDLDFVVPEKAINLTQSLEKEVGGKCVVLDLSRDIARLVVKGWTIDIASQVGNSLEDDLWRRDYRINAIAMTLGSDPKIIDPTGGIEDIFHKQLVAVREQNICDDPLRLIRGLRLMAEHELDLDPQTFLWIKEYSKLLPGSAPERVQLEIQLLIRAQWAEKVIPL